jgi:hypothetical protein
LLEIINNINNRLASVKNEKRKVRKYQEVNGESDADFDEDEAEH